MSWLLRERERGKEMAAQALVSSSLTSSVESARHLLGANRPLQSTRRASFVVRAASTPPVKVSLSLNFIFVKSWVSCQWVESKRITGKSKWKSKLETLCVISGPSVTAHGWHGNPQKLNNSRWCCRLADCVAFLLGVWFLVFLSPARSRQTAVVCVKTEP